MRLEKKYIKLGTSSGEINARDISANFTATNYTPAQIASEGNDKISAHFNGINTALGSIVPTTGDIGHTSFSAADNQASPDNITGLAFANGTVRSFVAILSVTRGATYAQYTLNGLQKASNWELVQTYIGDSTGLEFTITTAGQLQYTSTNTGAGATLKFRADVTQV